jgi:hypothetical protein
MGQRSQIYIRINNPLNNKSVVEDLKGFDKKGEKLKHAKRFFGEGKTSILAFYHQWLYGLTSAAVCANIMQQVMKSDSPKHILSKEIEELPYPSNYLGDADKVDGYVEVVTALLFNQFNIEFAEAGARYGVERVHDLFKDCYNKDGNYEEGCDCRRDFRNGDNNDGIMIIDVTTKKYCYIREIYKPKLITSCAETYVRGYYATTKNKLGKYYIEDVCKNDEAKIQELIRENKETCQFVREQFRGFKTLTIEEVTGIFPEVFKDLKEKEIEKLKKAQYKATMAEVK